VWATQAYKEEWVWRVPMAGGPAHAVVRVSGFAYGLAADESAAWMLSSTSDPVNQPDRTGRLRRLDQRTGEVTATTPLPDLAASLAVGPVWAAARSGWPARTRGCCTVAASCCGSIPPPAG
jgi:hypothetical protein